MKAPDSSFSNHHMTSKLLARYTMSLLDHSEVLAVALAEFDINRILDLSHKIKGSAGGYGFESISRTAALLEREIMAVESDTSLITDRVEDLISLCRKPHMHGDGGSDVSNQ